jgi:hypothetical protein
LREIREESPQYLKVVDSNLRSRHHIREYLQLKERNPQLIPKISQVVGPIKAYIRRPSHGESTYREIEKQLTYDLIRKDMIDGD